MPAKVPTDICVDCQEREATLNVRNRRLCPACFMRYVASKILKRMESYRFRNLTGDQKRRLFLPVSGGVSSLVLLQVLDAQLQRQISNRNKTAYHLVIARVVLPGTNDPAEVDEKYQDLARRFPLHTFLPQVSLHRVFRLDQKIRQDLTALGFEIQPTESDEAALQQVLSSTTSVSSRTDLEAILLRRLLVSIAREQDCESLLWGHSDSRLAGLTLANVAKGRGGSVSSNLADGKSLHEINFNYPARDLFKTELESYARALSDPLPYEADGTLSAQPTTNVRTMSIDTLLSNYISSQGEKYPGIMANVVRTATKLQTKNDEANVHACVFCVLPLSWQPGEREGNTILCYGCERMKQDMKHAEG
jgi:cytoplasmic tRNA 2-thiolation protein 2